MGQKDKESNWKSKVTSALYSQGTRQTRSREQQRNTANTEKQKAIQNFTQSIEFAGGHVEQKPHSEISEPDFFTAILENRDGQSIFTEAGRNVQKRPELEKNGRSGLPDSRWPIRCRRRAASFGKKQEEDPERPSFSASYQEKEDWFNQKIGQAAKKEEEPKERKILCLCLIGKATSIPRWNRRSRRKRRRAAGFRNPRQSL